MATDARALSRARARAKTDRKTRARVRFKGTTISATAGRSASGPMSRIRELSEEEVKLAYAQGEWASVIAKQLHDDGEVLE